MMVTARRVLLFLAMVMRPTPTESMSAECMAHMESTKASKTSDGKVILQAAGASFPDRLYRDAFFSYAAVSNVTISYTSIGSGSGKCRIKDYCTECKPTDTTKPGNIDFAGSDSLLKDVEYEKYPDLQMYPATAGAVVPIFNLNHVGITELSLTREVISAIFRKCKNFTDASCEQGSIRAWNDTRIVELNPDVADSLQGAGEIHLVVREDSSGTTEIFKKALASFDSLFEEQVGTSSSATWNNVDVSLADTNAGVAAKVKFTEGTIGYSVLAEALSVDVATISFVEGPNKTPVRATAESVAFALMEKGLDFGNNGDLPSRLTANVHNAQGSYAWPICGYTYFVVRKNTTRYGGTCEGRKEMLKFLEWFYTSSTVRSIAEMHGFAALPSEVSRFVLERLRGDLYCEDGEMVYQAPETVKIVLEVNQLLTPVLQIVKPLYELVEDSINFQVKGVKEATYETDETFSHKETLRLRFEQLERSVSTDAGIIAMPLVGVGIVPVFSLCGASLLSCEWEGLQVSMSIPVLAKILDGEITSWSDPEIQVKDSSGESVQLPAELSISVVRFSDHLDQSWEEVFKNQMRQFVSGFEFMASFSEEDSVDAMKARLVSTMGSIAIIPETVELNSGLFQKVHLLADDDSVLDATTESILRGWYPFSVRLVAEFPNRFSGEECKGLEQGKQFAKFVYWFLNPPNIEPSLSNNGMAFLPFASESSTRSLEHASQSVFCDGKSVMKPEHDLSLISGGTKVIMRSFVGLFVVICLWMCFWIYLNRRLPLLKASTYSFMLQILFGAMLSVTTIIPLTEDDRALFHLKEEEEGATSLEESLAIQRSLDSACKTLPYLFFVGYGLVFCPLLLKTWRIKKLFNNKKLKKLSLPNSLLIKYEIAILAPILSILTSWTIIDPLHWEREVKASDEFTGLPTKSIGRCVCNRPLVWITPLLAFILSTLIIGNYLSYKVRNVPVVFSEGKWIAVAMVNFLECFVLCTPIFIVTLEMPHVDVLMKCLFVLMVNFGTICIIFGPKVQMWMHNKVQSSSDAVNPRGKSNAWVTPATSGETDVTSVATVTRRQSNL